MDKIREEKWINTDEALEHLWGKGSTIREWIKEDNGIFTHKISCFWRFKKSKFDEWVNSGKSAE